MFLVERNRRPAPSRQLDIDKFFDSAFQSWFGSDDSQKLPAFNLVDKGEEGFEIQLAAPGLHKEDFSLETEEGVLRIHAAPQRNEGEEKVNENLNFKRKEFDYSTFSRSFRLSDKIDSQSISAHYEAGVLYVNLPLLEHATPQKRSIHVK